MAADRVEDVVRRGCTVPFSSVEARGFYLEGLPRTHGYLTLGAASK